MITRLFYFIMAVSILGIASCGRCDGPVDSPNLDLTFYNFPIGAKIVNVITPSDDINTEIGEQTIGYILFTDQDIKPLLLDNELKNSENNIRYNYIIKVYGGANLDSLISSSTLTEISFRESLGCNEITSKYTYKLNGASFESRIVEITAN